MFRTFGWPELLLILGIVLLIFGASRLPQLGKAIGKTIHNFRESLEGRDDTAPPEGKTKP